jgi:hypothetical protein
MVFSCSRGENQSFGAKEKFTPLTGLPCRGAFDHRTIAESFCGVSPVF